MSKQSVRKNLGERVLEIRKSKGFTQEKLGETANISYKFIGEVERGKVNVSIDSLVGIAKALDVQLHDLFTNGNDPIIKSHLSNLSIKNIETIKKAINLFDKTFSKM